VIWGVGGGFKRNEVNKQKSAEAVRDDLCPTFKLRHALRSVWLLIEWYDMKTLPHSPHPITNLFALLGIRKMLYRSTLWRVCDVMLIQVGCITEDHKT
jgi:hypothetical protein